MTLALRWPTMIPKCEEHQAMRLLRIQEVISVTGISRMTIYRLEKEGLFPSRRRLGKNSVAWLDDDISAWVAGRPTVTAINLAHHQHQPSHRLHGGTCGKLPGR